MISSLAIMVEDLKAQGKTSLAFHQSQLEELPFPVRRIDDIPNVVSSVSGPDIARHLKSKGISTVSTKRG